MVWAETPPRYIGNRQSAAIAINPNFLARGVWTLPIDTGSSEVFWFDQSKEFGMTGSMKYQINKISSETKELTMTEEGNTYVSVLTGYPTNAGMQHLYIDQMVETPFTNPLAIYEFRVYDGGFFQNPTLSIAYPTDWKLLSMWPPVKDTNPIQFDYPIETAYVSPTIAVFVPPPKAGNTVKTVGRFTLAGKTSSVARLERIISRLTFLDELFKSRIGVPAPERVIILSQPLGASTVGYEAMALATKAHLILLNESITQLQTDDEIALTLVHEITHLTAFDLNLFRGAVYQARWFGEGLAVFLENEARKYVFGGDTDKEVFTDEIVKDHLFSAEELTNKYQKTFDYLLDGSGYYSVYTAYTHSGLVLKNFFALVGVKGFAELLEFLKTADASPLCAQCDSDTILRKMSYLSNVSQNDLLFPYKNDPDFKTKISGLVHPEYPQSVVERVFRNYLKTVKTYFGTATGVPTVSSEEKVGVSTQNVGVVASPKIMADVQKVPVVTKAIATTTLNFGTKITNELVTQGLVGSSTDVVATSSPSTMVGFATETPVLDVAPEPSFLMQMITIMQTKMGILKSLLLSLF
jgi:hypothetical protein